MTALSVFAATSVVLVSWWKMLLMFIPFVAWAWLISAKLDKDARFYHLNHRMWNSIQLGAGAAALAAMLFIPFFLAGWPIGVAILLAPVLVYWRVRDQEVPEDKRFKLTGESLASRMDARKKQRADKQAVLSFTTPSGEGWQTPAKDDALYPVHISAEDIIGPALDARAARVEMSVGTNGCTISQMIDGVKYKREPLAPEAAVRLIDYIKRVGSLDVEDRRRRQDAVCIVVGPNGKTEIVIITAGSSAGQVMRLEFDRTKRLTRPFDALGLLPAQLEALRTIEPPHERHGVVLIAAPSGHGLTATGYSLISRHDAYTSNIKTLEKQVLIELDGVDHVQWDASNPDVDYATNLQSILRRDPDVVLISEVKDSDVATIAADPGLQGPLIYVPIVAGTIGEAVKRWVKLVGDLKQASKPLRAVTNQRLLRTLCPNCRQAYQPTADQLRKLNLPPSKVKELFRASGKVQIKNKIEDCPVCRGTGHLGQTAAFEVMMVDDDTRKLLSTGDLKGALAHARRNKMVYLQEAALTKVINGETTIEEVIRVTAPAGKSESAPAPRPNPTPA